MTKKIRHADKSRSNLTTPLCWAKSERALKREREPRRGWLASFAIALGISLCSPAQAHAPLAQWAEYKTDKEQAKNYAKNLLSKSQYHCLNLLYSKESGWQRTAYNKSGAYGIPQLKNKMISNMSGAMQTMYGLKYINARYSGDTCKALRHFRIHNWH